MIITVNSQLLATELRLLNKIVPTKPAIAILSHALLTADADELRFYATDLEVALTSSCHATITEPGHVALPVAKLLALVEQFANDDVHITVDKAVTIKCGAFKSKLQVIQVDDFPTQATVEGVSSTIDGMTLRQLITRTRYAINATASKFVMQGSLLTLAGSVAAMVATDSKRLALATGSRGEGLDQRFIIPMKTLDILASGSDSEIEVTIGPRHLHFSSSERILTSRMIDGEFPKYERIIPRDNDKIITVDRAVLMAALQRIVLVAEENRAIYFDVASNRLELSSASAEVGSADEALAVHYDGEPLKICVNGSYVLDFLEAATERTVTLALKDVKSAMLLTDGENHVAVIMLMRGY